jgi:hypothetical protein
MLILTGAPPGFMHTLNTRAVWGMAMAVYYLNRKGELVLSLLANEPRMKRRDRPRCGARRRKGSLRDLCTL